MLSQLPVPLLPAGAAEIAPWGLLGEAAVPVFMAGTRYPLAGLLLALPALKPAATIPAPGPVRSRGATASPAAAVRVSKPGTH